MDGINLVMNNTIETQCNHFYTPCQIDRVLCIKKMEQSSGIEHLANYDLPDRAPMIYYHKS